MLISSNQTGILLLKSLCSGYENSETLSIVAEIDSSVQDLASLIRKHSSIPENSSIHLFQIYAGRFDRELMPNDPVSILHGNRRHKSRIIAEIEDPDDEDVAPSSKLGIVENSEASKAKVDPSCNAMSNAVGPQLAETVLVLVCHFYVRDDDKGNARVILFDLPFTLRVRPDETVEDVKGRIKRKVKMPEAKFEELK